MAFGLGFYLVQRLVCLVGGGVFFVVFLVWFEVLLFGLVGLGSFSIWLVGFGFH